MKIKSSEHEITAVKPHQYPEADLPEVAFAGRSNVGKSSMINALLNRKKLAYVGNTPGKTRQLNFYIINNDMRLVDLPGYGYAKVSKAERKSLGALTTTYLSNRSQLKLIVMLTDIRHKPTMQDKEMSEWLIQSGIPFAICVTKSDKIAKGKHKKHIADIVNKLELPHDTPLVLFSATKKLGVENLWDIIEYYLFENEEELDTI